MTRIGPRGFGLALALVSCGGDVSNSGAAFALSLQVEPAFTIGAPDDPFTPDLETNFGISERFLIVGALPGLVHTFDMSGTFAQEIDRRGQGPGEFSGRVLPLWTGADEVVLLDQRSGQYIGIDLDSNVELDAGALVRDIGDAFRYGDGWIVTTRLDERGAYDILHLHADGSSASLLGGLPPEIYREEGPPVIAQVAGFVVSSPANRYALRLHPIEQGAETRVLPHVPEFFPPPTGDASREAALAFPPRILRLAPGPDDGLWVVSLVPTEREGSIDDMLETWVELIDIESGDVLATTSFPGVSSMTRDGRWSYRFDATGPLPRIHFGQVSVAPAPVP